jgi:hypothetical protein
MRHQIPGLDSRHQDSEAGLDGLFLVRVDKGWFRRHPQKPFVELRFVILEPAPFQGRSFFGRLYCTEKALWKLHWFLRNFGYDADLLNRDQVDEKALANLRGVVGISHKIVHGQSYQNLDSFAPASDWEVLSHISPNNGDAPGAQGGSDGL